MKIGGGMETRYESPAYCIIYTINHAANTASVTRSPMKRVETRVSPFPPVLVYLFSRGAGLPMFSVSLGRKRTPKET